MRRSLFLVTTLVAALHATGTTVAGASASAKSDRTGVQLSVVVTPNVHHDVSPPLRDILPSRTPGRVYPAKRIPGQSGPVVRARDTSGNPGAVTPSPSANFEGISANGSAPPDTQGVAGTLDQYFQMANTRIAVYTKSGGVLIAPEPTNTLWAGFGGGCQTNNNGDGVVLFDSLAQRWVAAQFSVSAQPFLYCVAVSATADATGAYNRYSFTYSDFPDYPKMGIWPDAYYATFNLFDPFGIFALGTEVCAYDRASMLNGLAATQQCFQPYTSGTHTLLPASVDGATQPPVGEENFMVGLSATPNNLVYFKFHVDWTTPSNTTLVGPTNLAVASFSQACGGGTCIRQSQTNQRLDSLGDRVMARLAYRNFGTSESLVVTHSIAAGTSVGARWYELRISGGNLTVFQQGTHAPDSAFRWMGSVAMDQAGDIALGYSVSSPTLHPGIRYAGRSPSDPPGTMQTEVTAFTGNGSQTGGLSRWGDYSAMAVDPVDGCTFWYTTEYIPSNGSFNWHTRIVSFKYPTCGGPPPPDDFSISADPASLTIIQGQSGASTIGTTITQGQSQSVVLSASGLPNDTTASFSPNPINSGSSSTMNITVGSTTPVGTYSVTVTGTGPSATHSTTISLTVNSSGGGSVVTNGGFETGDLTGWTTAGSVLPTIQSGGAHTGTYSAKIGSSTAFAGNSTLQQTIIVPSTGGTLTFWYNPHCLGSFATDRQIVQIRNTGGGALATVLNVCSNSAAWTQVSFSVNTWASQTIVLWFNVHDDNNPNTPTYMLLDDVSVQ